MAFANDYKVAYRHLTEYFKVIAVWNGVAFEGTLSNLRKRVESEDAELSERYSTVFTYLREDGAPPSIGAKVIIDSSEYYVIDVTESKSAGTVSLILEKIDVNELGRTRR